MSSIFKIISSNQWEDAKISGLVPRCSADIEANCVFVNQFDDIETVCSHYFEDDDFPVALEFASESYPGSLEWLEPSEEKPWKEGKLNVEHLMADLVLTIYSLEPNSSSSGVKFRLQGE